MTAGRILVVDDHQALAENLAEVLQSAGFSTEIAGSAEEALAIVEKGGIGAVITDFRLPGRNGAQLIEELRRRKVDVPAVVMSAYTDPATVATAEEAGALEFLPKPIDLPRLMELVKALGGSGDVDVLVVDDNRPFAENIAEILKGKGLRVFVGTTAEEALGQRTRPRAALLDFRLPDRNGVEVARRLAARDPGVRIAFISAYCDEIRDEMGADLPHATCIPKPVDFDRLLRWLADVIPDASNPGR